MASYLDWQQQRQKQKNPTQQGGFAAVGEGDGGKAPEGQYQQQTLDGGVLNALGPPQPTAPPPAAPQPQAPAQNPFNAMGGGQPQNTAPGATAATGANATPAQPNVTQAPQTPGTDGKGGPVNNNGTPAQTVQQQGADFNTWAKQTFGVEATPAQMTAIQQKVGPPAGPNGTYTPQQIDAAKAQAMVIAQGLGWKGAGAAAAPAGPTAPATGPNAMNAAFTGTNPGDPGNTGRVIQDPGQGYQAQQLGAFQQANTGNVNAMNTALMERIQANPESMSPEVIAQMKAAGKTSAAKQQEQLRQQASTNLASRGFSGAGGMQAAADGAVDQNFLESLLDSNRNVDIQAAGQNFNDRLNVAQAGSQFQNDATNRAVANAGAENSRFGLNEGMRQAQSADQLARSQFKYGQQSDDRTANLQEWMSRNSVNLDTNRLGEQQRQFNQTFGFDVTRFLDDIRRDNRNFGEGQRQYNGTTGLQYNQLETSANQNMMQWLAQNAGMGSR